MLDDFPQLIDQSYEWGPMYNGYTPSPYPDFLTSGYNSFASPTYTPPSIDFGSYGGSNQFFLDTNTGQIVPGSGLMDQSPSPLAPTAPQTGFPTGMGTQQGVAPTMGGQQGLLTSTVPGRPSDMPISQSLPQWVTPGNVGLGSAAITSLIGLAGVIQKAVQGDEKAKQEVSTRLAAASPQEQQAINLMLQQAQQGIDIQKRATDVLGPILQNMAQGQLNISPQLQSTVGQIFSPLLGNIVQQGIQNAQERGFAGNPGEGPAAAVMAPLFSNAQGQMAQMMAEMAMGLPMNAVQGYSALSGLNTNLVNALGQTAATAQRPRLAEAQTTTTTSKPFQILDTLQPLSQIASGVGGTLGAIGAMDRGTPQAPPGYQYMLMPVGLSGYGPR